jgi:hypothetical protein
MCSENARRRRAADPALPVFNPFVRHLDNPKIFLIQRKKTSVARNLRRPLFAKAEAQKDGSVLISKSRWGERPREPLKPKAHGGSRGRSPHQIRTLPKKLVYLLLLSIMNP